jgi:hypothetical protein
MGIYMKDIMDPIPPVPTHPSILHGHILKLNYNLPESSFGCDLLNKVTLVFVDSDLILTRDADDDVTVAQDRQTDRPVEIPHLNKLKLRRFKFT